MLYNSLKFILGQSENEKSVVMTFEEFLEEKRQFQMLREKKFFRQFQETKYFSLWSRRTRVRRFSKAQEYLSRSAVFSYAPLGKIAVKLKEVMYNLESDVLLFSFNEVTTGALPTPEYFKLQTEKIHFVKRQILTQMEKISEYVTVQFQTLTNDDFLKDLIDYIVEFHPFVNAEAAGVSIDWANVRSVKVVITFSPTIDLLLRNNNDLALTVLQFT